MTFGRVSESTKLWKYKWYKQVKAFLSSSVGKVDAFELWCWRGLLRVCWTARRSNQSILKGINPKYSLEGLMLKLKLQYSDHPMWRTDSFEKTLMLEKIEGRRRRWQQRMRWLDGINRLNGHEFEQTLGDNERQGSLMCYSPWGCKKLDTTEWLNNNKDKKYTLGHNL